jgi:outer membrane lipoprotein SlyB
MACLIVVGCGSSDDGGSLADDTDAAIAGGQGDSIVDCAPGGAAEFSRDCTVDQVQGAKGLELTIHHKDGSFRRLLVTKDGRGVVAADGAAVAVVTVRDAQSIEVKVEDDRYILPATVKQPGAAAAAVPAADNATAPTPAAQ